MTRTKIVLSVNFDELAEDAKRFIRKQYKRDRLKGWSIDDARYYANYLVDCMRDDAT